MHGKYYNMLGTTWHRTIITVVFFKMVKGGFEIAFKLLHLFAYLTFQVFSMQIVTYIYIYICAHTIIMPSHL